VARRSEPRFGPLAASVLVIVLAVTACEAGSRTAQPGESAAIQLSPARTTTLSLPDGLRVSVPGSAVTSHGTLSAKLIPAPAPPPPGLALDGPVYDLRVNGTALRGRVRLTVPVPASWDGTRTTSPAGALLAFFDPAGSDWQLVPARYDAATQTLVATSPHLSQWSVLTINARRVLDVAADALKGFLGVASAPAPSCPDSAQLPDLGVKVAADIGDLVHWCADDDQGPLLRVTSNRDYPLEVDYPASWSVSRAQAEDPVTGQILSSLPALSLEVSGPSVRTAIIPAGQELDIAPSQGSSGYVRVSPSVEGIIVAALLFSADTLAMTYGDVPGVPASTAATTAQAIAETFDDTSCVADMDTAVHDADVSTAQAAGSVFRDFTDIATGCLARTWATAYGLAGFQATFVTSTLLWLSDGIQLILADSQALVDSAFYWQGYHIYVLSSTPKQPQANPSLPEIVSTRTYVNNGLVYFSVRYTNPAHNAAGFGFAGVNGSGWAPEQHPFSSPSYGIIGADTVDYPFNLGCGTASQVGQSQVEVWIYTTAGQRSMPVVITLTCNS
jgi:hypothetical protein